jgi:hypothetical protein
VTGGEDGMDCPFCEEKEKFEGKRPVGVVKK